MSGTDHLDALAKELESLGFTIKRDDEGSVTTSSQIGYFRARVNGCVTIDATCLDEDAWKAVECLQRFAKGFKSA
jgi:hypothetical protein